MFRWIVLAVLVSNLTASKHFRRKARQASGTIERRREGGAFMVVRALVALPLLLSILAYVVNPGWMEWSTLTFPDSARWLGAGAGILSVPLVFWVLRSIGSNISETVLTKQRHELVTTGPYRWVRHPLYTSSLIMLVSIGVMASNGFILVLTGVALLLVWVLVIPREEANLLQRFPDQYADYRGRTGRLIPRSIRGAA